MQLAANHRLLGHLCGRDRCGTNHPAAEFIEWHDYVYSILRRATVSAAGADMEKVGGGCDIRTRSAGMDYLVDITDS